MTTLFFKVTWGDDKQTSSFSEVSGLTMEADAVDYRGGADLSLSVRKIPGLRKYGNVTLKRGIAPVEAGNGLFEWYRGVAVGRNWRRTVVITLNNELQQPVMSWTIQNAWPVKVEGPGLKATGNEIAIETVEFVHEGIQVEVV